MANIASFRKTRANPYLSLRHEERTSKQTLRRDHSPKNSQIKDSLEKKDDLWSTSAFRYFSPGLDLGCGHSSILTSVTPRSLGWGKLFERF